MNMPDTQARASVSTAPSAGGTTETSRHAKRLGGNAGQAMAEFAIAFPLQLLLTFGVIQIGLLYMSALVTEYAAFRAARAGIVELEIEDAEEAATEAARLVLSPFAHSGPTENETVTVPGVGEIRGSGRALDRVRVELEQTGNDGNGNPRDLKATVVWHQQLVFPVVDTLFAFVTDAAEGDPFGEHATYASFEEAAAAAPSTIAGQVHTIDGRHYFVIVRDCTLFMRQATNPSQIIEGN